MSTSILAPAGPQRSRILAALNRDDRTSTSLPAYLPSMLRKMLLEYIVRPEEVKEFEAGLAEHQRATVEGGGTVLERAVREHNVGACAKVYDNISFEALGALLNLDPEAAEVTARRMIEQGRYVGPSHPLGRVLITRQAARMDRPALTLAVLRVSANE